MSEWYNNFITETEKGYAVWDETQSVILSTHPTKRHAIHALLEYSRKMGRVGREGKLNVEHK